MGERFIPGAIGLFLRAFIGAINIIGMRAGGDRSTAWIIGNSSRQAEFPRHECQQHQKEPQQNCAMI
jgi:hypothetical protein